MSTIGERIRERRQKLGYTQERLSQVARLSKGFVSEIESGNRNVSAETCSGSHTHWV